VGKGGIQLSFLKFERYAVKLCYIFGTLFDHISQSAQTGIFMSPKKTAKNKTNNGATLGIEAQLWQAADKLRGHLDAAEYKNVVLGLIFLKYISDAFERLHSQLVEKQAEGADPEDRDEYTAERVFWVPKEARWAHLKANAKQPNIGNLIDDAMLAIERDNPSLRGVLPGNYGRATLDKQRLGGLVDLISGINFVDEESRKQDVLGRVYEYFLSQFASAEGKKGGEFYTPRSVVRVLVEMLAPYKGRVFDPCCGSGGMFVQSEKFVEAHGGRIGDISIYGQESNPNTWKLAKMNLAIRGIEGDLKEPADSFLRDLHPDLKADYILANPPFNMSDWGGENLREDKRWKYGAPPVGNANFAWVQHFIHHLSPKGMAGFVLANGSMSSNTSGEGEIRKAIIEDDLVDCMVALPGQLFYSTQIPVCLWFLARDKTPSSVARHLPQNPQNFGGGQGGGRDRRGQTLFIDARKLGYMVDRVHRDLSDEDIALIANTYHAWRAHGKGESLTHPYRPYADIPGFCKSVTIEEIRAQGYVLTPGRYVGAAEAEEDDEPFEQKMARLTKELEAQFEESARLEEQIRENLKRLDVSPSPD
jgi:type I restriction enzyme M protein